MASWTCWKASIGVRKALPRSTSPLVAAFQAEMDKTRAHRKDGGQTDVYFMGASVVDAGKTSPTEGTHPCTSKLFASAQHLPFALLVVRRWPAHCRSRTPCSRFSPMPA